MDVMNKKKNEINTIKAAVQRLFQKCCMMQCQCDCSNLANTKAAPGSVS